MKKQKNSVLFLIAILVILIVGVYLAYDKLYIPSARTYATYLAVHQELDQAEADSLKIDTSNHKVVILPSDDDKVKIVFYQKSDNANVLSNENKRFELTMVERVENLDNILFKSEKKIDTIYIYLPLDKAFTLSVKSVDGQLTVNGVKLKELTFNNTVGDVSITNCELGRVTINTNTSNLLFDNNTFSNLAVDIVAGTCQLKLPGSLYASKLNIKTMYGNILINGEQLKAVDEEGNEVINRELVQSEGEGMIRIGSTRAKIDITSVEPVEEEPVEETQESQE